MKKFLNYILVVRAIDHLKGGKFDEWTLRDTWGYCGLDTVNVPEEVWEFLSRDYDFTPKGFYDKTCVYHKKGE